ncbi:TPA: hypothetical protein MEA92_004846 [Klebsiella aerogenes]|uniref:hypothetical protein n=1 Tax=Enterobacteriaceae TaxID=543 RepID=UPI0005EE8DF9|nr:hypothetical protein [Klebsiella aerogenes]KJO59144.1 hypothetical protein SR89_09910 [Klebsiella aerogenes]HBV9945978.1 hypothetical protein [Klebsiella aerogenes]
MNDNFSESVRMLEDKLAAHNFWHQKIKEVLRDRATSMEYDREISKLVPQVARILRYPTEHRGMNRVIDLKRRWDENDGNPIFYGYFPFVRRAIRIIQAPPIDETNQLSAWVEKSFTDYTKEVHSFYPEDSDELVIYIELNATTLHYAMLIIYFWGTRRVVRGTTQEILIQQIYDTKIRGEHSLD